MISRERNYLQKRGNRVGGGKKKQKAFLIAGEIAKRKLRKTAQRFPLTDKEEKSLAQPKEKNLWRQSGGDEKCHRSYDKGPDPITRRSR